MCYHFRDELFSVVEEASVIDERWLTVEEVAKIARVHEQTVRRWLRSGQLPGHLINRRAGYRVRYSDLERFLSGEELGKTHGLNSQAASRSASGDAQPA